MAAVAGAGDVNGDGLADLVVSAASSAYVVFGKRSADPVGLGTLGAGGFRVSGLSPATGAGAPVAGAGDVNGDGLADVIIGDIGVSRDGFGNAGAAYVVFGKSSSTAVDVATLGSGGYAIDGAPSSAFAGTSVAGTGDVNADGRADIIVGAPYANGPDGQMSGAAYVVFGKSSPAAIDLGALGSAGFVGHGPVPFDTLGASVAGAGDVNGDGHPDVIVGAAGADEAFVVYGFGAPELTYAGLTASVGTPIPTLGPTTLRRTGAPAFTVSPALPPGLTLDAASGTITGTPQAAQPRTTYTVVMTDLAGTTIAPLPIEIDAALRPPVGVGPSPRTAAPRLVVSGRRAQRLLARKRIVVRAGCDEPCTLTAAGKVRIVGARPVVSLRSAHAMLAAPGATTLELTLSRMAQARLGGLLGRRRRAVAVIAIHAADSGGRITSSQLTISVRR